MGLSLPSSKPRPGASFGFVIALTQLYLEGGFGQVLLARSYRDRDFQVPVGTGT